MRVKNSKLASLFALLMLSILFNCSSKKTEKATFPTIHITPNMDTQKCNLSDLASGVKVVNLETNPDCFIGHFSSLLHVDEHNIIYETGNNKILIFDSEGNFIRKIYSFGNGPEEYNTIISATVDPINKKIFIVDTKKVLIFNYEGVFIKKINTPFLPAGLHISSKGQIVVPVKQNYSQDNRSALHILDSTFNTIQSFKSRNPEVTSGIRQNLFYTGRPYKIKNKLYFKEPFVDTIYEVNSKNLKPHWKIDLGGMGFKTKEGINTINHQKALKDKIPPIGIKESSNLFIFSYVYKIKRYLSVYDKNSNKYVFHQGYIQDDLRSDDLRSLDFGIKNDFINNSLNFWPKSLINDFIIDILDPASLKKEQQVLFNCREGDNYVLLVAKIKKT